MDKKDIEEMATNHANWYAEHIKIVMFTVYKDAFIHGYKHGKVDKNVGDNKTNSKPM